MSQSARAELETIAHMYRQKHYDECIKEVKAKLKKSPGSLHLLNYQAMAYSALKKDREALQSYENILKKDPSLIRESILNWAKIRWPEDPPRRLQAIGEKEKKLKDPLLMMERHYYAEQNEEWDAQQLAEAFKLVCHVHQEKIDEYKDRIRELYPA